MRKLLVLFVLAAFFLLGSPAQAGKVGYPMQFCTGPSGNPTTCSWVTSSNPLPVRFAAGAVGGLVQVAGVNGTSVATNANPLPTRLSADGTNPVDATHPLAMGLSDGTAIRPPPWQKADDDDGTNEVAIPSVAPVNYTLPAAGWYEVTAAGNSACVKCGAAPVPVMNTDCPIKVLEGATRRLWLTGPVCAVIGPSAAGYVNFLHLNPAL